jgi:hypothetical protein
MIRRIAMVGAAAALGVSGIAAPALAAHTPAYTAPWTAAHCASWRSHVLKTEHNKPTAKQKASANKIFARHGCKIRL